MREQKNRCNGHRSWLVSNKRDSPSLNDAVLRVVSFNTKLDGVDDESMR